MPQALLTNPEARRLFLDRHLLLRPAVGEGRNAHLAGLVRDLGFVQIDSVNTLARAHDLILWSRAGRYRPAALERLIARDRAAFEHWTHDAAVIPMDFFPMWRLKFARDEARMQSRWTAPRRESWSGELDAILRHIRDNGPVCASDMAGDEPRSSGGWWDWHPSKTALEFLWRSGRLSICHRAGFRKFYDLTERVIPETYLSARMDPADTIDWAMRAALDRLGFATSRELAAFFDIATSDEASAWCRAALSDGRIVEIDAVMADGQVRRSFSTPEILDGLAHLPAPTPRVRLLSPFDPALRDRNRAERLFGFHYRIEIFVPAPKRRYGYYVFPVLQGDRLIGRVDAKREGQALTVRAFWPEPGIRIGQQRSKALIAEFQRILPFANLTELSFDPDWLRE